MEQEIDRLIQIWKGPFANKHSDNPRLSAIASANDVALQLAGTRRRLMGGLTGDVVLAFSFWERAR